MNDSFLQQGLRNKLVDSLKLKGITDTKILEAIRKIPRHLFMEIGLRQLAYMDRPVAIAAGQTISHPSTVAFQTQLLQLQKFDKVLEIGTGSGYQTAVLSELGALVYTIERQKELYIKARAILNELNYHVHAFWGDGYLGQVNYAPFQKILVTAGAPSLPVNLIKQLAIGGLMVIPIGEDAQIMTVIKRVSENKIETSTYGNYNFVPMLEGTQSK